MNLNSSNLCHGGMDQLLQTQLATVEEVNRYLEIQDLAERDAYKKSLPEQRNNTQTYSIGEQTEEIFND